MYTYRKLILIVLLVPVLFVPGSAGNSTPIRQVRAIPLHDVKGRIDHLDIDLARDRLFVAARDNNSVEVINFPTGTIESIRQLEQPQGVVVIPERKLLCVTNAGDGTLRFYKTDSLAEIRTLKFSSDADNLRYDKDTKRLYVGYGTGGIGIVDAEALKRTGDIALSGHPESFQIEKNGKRIFVNVPAARHIAVLDKLRNSLAAPWPVPADCSNFAMALDEMGKRLFVGCRASDRVLVYDTDSGKLISEFPVSADADDIFFDAAHERVYVSCGSGVLQVFERKAGNYRAVANILTGEGARTSLFVPEQHTLYVPVPAGPDRQAEILIFSIGP